MSEKKEKGKSLIKNIGLFFLASFVPRTISFFMVPLYTHCLTAGEYGTIDLISTTVLLLLPILTLQVQDAVLRFALDKEQDPARVYSVGLRIVAVGCGVLFAGTGIACAAGFLRLNWTYMLFFLASFVIGALHNVTAFFLRAIDKVRCITASSILNSVVTVSANLLFLLVLDWGVNGYLLANTLGHAASFLLLFVTGDARRYVLRGRPDRALTREIIAFSVPMVASSLSWWVNHSLDKYILSFFWGVAASGLLAVAYKIPTVISVCGMIFAKAFSVSVVENFDAEDTDGFLGQSYATVSFLLVLCASGLMIINVPLAKFMFAKDFFAAWQIVPPLLLSAVMNHLSTSCEHICIALKRTDVISITAMLGAFGNTALNFALIPVWGGYGAAVATAVSFAAVWLLRYVWVRKRVKLKNCAVKEPLSYAVLLVQMALAYWGNRFILLQILLAVLLVALYGKELLRAAATVKRSFG